MTVRVKLEDVAAELARSCGRNKLAQEAFSDVAAIARTLDAERAFEEFATSIKPGSFSRDGERE